MSRGIGIGRFVRLEDDTWRPLRVDVAPHRIDAEIQRFRSALNSSIHELRQIVSDSGSARHASAASIFGVQLLILESSFAEKIQTVIGSERVNAEWAIRTVSEQYRERQDGVPDENFREKSLDIDDIAHRLVSALGLSSDVQVPQTNAVIFARELSPMTVAELGKSHAAGLITMQGGWTSHAAIVARELGIPMVCGVRDLDELVSHSEPVIVDGNNGEVIVSPTDKTVAGFKSLILPVPEASNAERPTVDQDMTADDVAFVVRANIDQADKFEVAKSDGAKGIGLYRSESLIQRDGKIPKEEEQVDVYTRLAEFAGVDGVRLRTFDVGIDQLSKANSFEPNPALGLRAIRLSLVEPTQFRVQIRAIQRASFGRKIDIVLPMISGVDDLLWARAIIDQERNELEAQGVAIGDSRLGAMIETPSAVLTAHEIAQHVDFLCVGTNDLVQYLLAVDRDNDAVAAWYQTLHPAVLRALTEIISAGASANIPVTFCGEMAGSPFYAPVLLGLGAREFSMNLKSITPIRRLLSSISVGDATDLVANILTLNTAREIEDHLRKYYAANWASLLPEGFLDTPFRNKR